MKIFKAVSLSALCILSTSSFGRTLRPGTLNEKELRSLFHSHAKDVFEFREGDQIPLTLKVEGNVLQSISPVSTMITIKKSFFLRFDGDHLMMSWDGGDYLPYRDMVASNLEVEADASSPVAAVDIIFGAFIKN